MLAIAISLAIFVLWCGGGLGILAAARIDMRERVDLVLLAPVIGSAVYLLPLFLASYAGASMQTAARPTTFLYITAAGVTIFCQRPAVRGSALPVLGICIATLAFVGWPFWRFGLDWIANANADMGNYVLSATNLLHHALLLPIDRSLVARDLDFASLARVGPNVGSRPGADITLAAVSALFGKAPYELFMPFILACFLCLVAAVGALAVHGSGRVQAAWVAAALVAVSPLTVYGVVQQLLPQVWGLAAGAGLLALLMQERLYRPPGVDRGEAAIIALLASAFILIYVELAATLAFAYFIYVAVLAIGRRVSLRSAARLWSPVVLSILIIHNGYLTREVHYIRTQFATGTAGSAPQHDAFGFTLVPPALPGILGLQTLPTSQQTRLLSLSILITIAVFIGVGAIACASVARRVGLACVLIAYLIIGILLSRNNAAFGLFKLYMYVQPFLAAFIATLVMSRRRFRATVVLLVLATVGLFAVQANTTRIYVARSENPIDLRHASAGDLLPRFRGIVAATGMPIVSDTGAITPLAKLEAASMGSRPLYILNNPLSPYNSHRLVFAIPGLPAGDPFDIDPLATHVLSGENCTLAILGGSITPLNRSAYPADSPRLSALPCRNVRDVLIFTPSELGQGYYAASSRRDISFYQLEPDYFYSRATYSGFGRYALFRVVNPSKHPRLVLDFTRTIMRGRSQELPPVAVLGTRRWRLGTIGRGSARVISAPLTPKRIGGAEYLLLDMGVNGQLPVGRRHGISNIFGHAIPEDLRWLTSYVRNVSLITGAQFRERHPPTAVSRFPQDLANPNLEYSGIYEDGWIAEDSFVRLAGGPRTVLDIQANVLAAPHQHMSVFVNSRRVADRTVPGGGFHIKIAVPASRVPRRVELHFSRVVRLAAPARPAVARLIYLGIQTRRSAPRMLQLPRAAKGLIAPGLYSDGWTERSCSFVLRGGPRTDLYVRGLVPEANGQHLKVVVNNQPVASEPMAAGPFSLRVRIPASETDRLVELHWRLAVRLRPPDTRRAAALLRLASVGKP